MVRGTWIASACIALLAAGAPSRASAATDARLCQRALELANDGALAATILRPDPAAHGETERWQQGGERWGYVAGAYTIDRGDGALQRLLAIEQGGTCHSTGLVREDGTALTLEPLVEADENFGLDTVPARIDGAWVALAVWRDRWRFRPLALGRLDARGVVPLCRFESTGEVRREPDAPADAACDALATARVEHVSWAETEPDAMPASGLPAHEAMRASLDWPGLGTRSTWKLRYESSAGCGMTYEWLALDAGTPAGPALDTGSTAGRALFPAVEREVFQRGPWWLDAVFVHEGRAWFAGQPQWGDTEVGDHAVYRLDADGVHVQCRYRHVPQYRIGNP